MAKENSKRQLMDQGLVAAAAASSILKVRNALDFGADPRYQDPDQFGWSALHFCCYFSGAEKSAERICKILLARQAPPNAKAIDGTTPLLAACAVGSLDVVALLLQHGADANLQDKVGKTPLMAAAERGSVFMVELLLSRGALLTSVDVRGLDAMAVASSAGRPEIVAVLESASIRAEIDPTFRRAKL